MKSNSNQFSIFFKVKIFCLRTTNHQNIQKLLISCLNNTWTWIFIVRQETKKYSMKLQVIRIKFKNSGKFMINKITYRACCLCYYFLSNLQFQIYIFVNVKCLSFITIYSFKIWINILFKKILFYILFSFFCW